MRPLLLKMKNDLPSLENSGQLMWPTSEVLAGTGHVVRCYECSFCKRGFSNAQALGGHMNIHRRDRAKLKLNSHEDDDDDNRLLSLDLITNSNPFSDSLTDQNQVSLDMITKVNPLINVPAAEVNRPGEIDQSSSTDKEKLCTTHNKRPWIIPKKLDDTTRSDKAHVSGEVVLLQQQSSSSIIHDDLKNLSCTTHIRRSNEQSSDGPATLEVLDLELRLGHEPQHYYPSTTTG